MRNFLEIFKTNGQVNDRMQWIIGIVWIVCTIAFWTVSRWSVLPNAPEVASAGVLHGSKVLLQNWLLVLVSVCNPLRLLQSWDQ